MSELPVLLVDEHEPRQIWELLEQSCPVEIVGLNRDGLADYVFIDHSGFTRQIERKQTAELLSGIDDVENQLRKEILSADATDLLVEGIMRSTQWGIDSYQWDAKRGNYKLVRSFGDRIKPRPHLYPMILSWFWGLDKAGITVWQTTDYESTAKAIVAFYSASRKGCHTILQRYLKPKQTPRTLDHSILSLMGIEKAELGSVKATALIQKFGSVYGVLTADPKELETVDGIGKKGIARLFQAIGREI